MPENINRIVRASQAGDREAFGKLYDLFYKKIYFFIYYRSYHKETAEDIASLTFLKSLESIGTFDPDKGAFSTWIYRIARNCLIDHYRTKLKSVDIEDVWDIPGDADIELDMQNRENWEKLKPYLTGLSSDERNIVFMRVWDDMPYKEIAKVMNKSESACKMAFARSLAYLREAMPVLLFLSCLLLKKQNF